MSAEQVELTGTQDPIVNEEEGIGPEILSAGEVRVLIPYDSEVAHYNAAVIRSIKNPGDLLILLREVPLASIKSGIPDKGNLLIYRSTPDNVEKIGQLDLSDPAVNGWEDARAYSSDVTIVDDQGIESEVSIGLTAIRASDNKPVAATLKGVVVDGNLSIEEGSLLVYPEDVGKNVTPVSLTEFLFRREDSDHTLEVVEHGQDENGQNKLNVKKTIRFPQKSWCRWRIGTQAQILPMGMLPIHGVNKFSKGTDPKTGKEVEGFTYSMGLAQLDHDLNVIKISDRPLFTRESFQNILPMGIELNTDKNVVYCCGYSCDEDKVKFVINIGDLMTVEVSRSLADLKKILDDSC